MSLTLRIGLIVLSLIFIVYVFNNVNKRKLQLQFSLIWLLIALVIIVIAVFPQIVYFAAKFIGIEVSSNLVYLIAIITLMFILINLTMNISKMSNEIKNIIQSLSIKDFLENERKDLYD